MLGIDKSKLNNITINYIDIDKFRSNDNVTVATLPPQAHGYLIPTDDDYINVSYLGITDEALFDKLQVGIKKNKGSINPYALLEITIADNTNNNLIPYSVSDYHSRLERIAQYLEQRYGLYVTYENATFSELELNVTQKMHDSMTAYYHILSLMLNNAPKRYKTRALYTSSNGSLTGLTASNNSTQLKIYDKTHQLDTCFKIKVNGEYMRIEYTLKNSQRIKRALGTTSLSEITDNKIKQFLHTEIEKDLISPLMAHIEYSNKELKKLYRQVKSTTKRGYIKEFTLKALSKPLNTQGDQFLLFDIQQIKDIATASDKNNKARSIKLIDSLTEDHSRFQNNFEKLNEIINKFTK